MKKYILLMVSFVLFTLLIGCQGDAALSVTYDEDLSYASYFKDDNPLIKISVKDYGDLFVELFKDVAPITVDNFIAYIQDNAFENSTFHRVINNFMIQGGIVEDTQCSILGEFQSNGITNPLAHQPGVIAMARTSNMNSATSQFFINEVNNNYLNGQYASFGGLVSGFDVLSAISEVSTNSNDQPMTPVVITSIIIDLRGYEPSPRTCYGT